MSEPVSNAEVEDVLASIRRLVSEEKRPAMPGTAQAIAEPNVEVEHVPEIPEKLVLTPALRVANTSEIEQQTAAPQEARAEDEVPEADFIHAESEDEDLGRTFVFKPLSPGTETETVLDNALQTPGEQSFDFKSSDHSFDTDDAFDAEIGSESDLLPELEDDALQDHDVDAEVEADSADYGSGDTTEPDVSEDVGDLSHESDIVTPSQLRPGVDVPISLSAKIAALEAVIGKRPDQWEPDGVAQDPYSGTEEPTMAWEDHKQDADSYTEASFEEPIGPEPTAGDQSAPDTPSDVVEQFETDPIDAVKGDIPAQNQPTSGLEATVVEHVVADAEEQAAKSILSSDVDELDEESLRDMVAEIVRQELQGALGERITRNVRKLVRREIHRALATQDLE